jgi:putative salt-induced outer membrane protein YdiY
MHSSIRRRSVAREAAWICIVSGALASAFATADVVTTTDGARLTGTINKITPKQIELKTTWAGDIVVKMDQVASYNTDAPLTTQYKDSTTVTGVTALDEQKTIRVTGGTLASATALDELQASWVPGTTPPPESLFDTRHWTYQVGVDLTGKSGNSDERTTNLVTDMRLVSKIDELRFYGSYQTAEQDGNKTSDETIGGASYTAYMYEPWGWYVRGELEKDKFEDIDLRTTLAAGGSWRPIHTDERTLSFFLGLGYRHESYDNNVESDGYATLDTGVANHWQLKPWLTLDNSLAYSPALDDFHKSLITHDSSFAMPVGAARWLLRMGVHNDYNNEPAPGRDHLDTTYYTRLLFKFE